MTKSLTLLLIFIFFLNNNINAAAAVASMHSNLTEKDVGYQKYVQEYLKDFSLLANAISEKLSTYGVTERGIASIMAGYALPFCTYDQWLNGLKIIDVTNNIQFDKAKKLEEVKKLLKSGACVYAHNNGNTPLSFTAMCGYTEIVKLLIANKANVNARNNLAYTPLLFAAIFGYTEIAKLLLASGADVNATNSFRCTPLISAVTYRYTEITRLLLDYGAYVDATDGSDSPLTLAAKNGYTEIAELLLARRANVNVRDHYGNTPLMLAIIADKTEIVELLVANGADVHARNNLGETALIIAKKYGRSDDIVKLLHSNYTPNRKCIRKCIVS